MNTQQRGKAARLARRRMVDGRLTAPLPADRHGAPASYVNHDCRCVACTQGWASYPYARTEAAR